MKANPILTFPPFRLDVANEQLWHGEQLLPLRPKPFAILRYLVERPGQLVTKDELLKAIWPQTYVSEGLLHTYLRDLRHVLNDDPEAPRFIETVVRRGYRFIAPLTEGKASSHAVDQVAPPEPAQSRTPAPSVIASSSSFLVGREAALASLQERLALALTGKRQLVFVTGEPGIGKTTLVDTFLEHVSARQDLWIGRGQCVGQYGAGEAYLPILEALGRLGRTSAGERLLPLLRRHAPSWLVQLPALLTENELATLQRKVQGTTRERMLRELTEVLEVLTAESPLVLVLEDLHWSDASTVDFLTAVAQRREVARLLVLGTYRPADMIVSGHPLRISKEELQLHKQCTELGLTFLTTDDVTQYLSMRFAQHQFPQAFGQRLQQHTEGNPLFLVNTVEDLVTRQVIDEREGQWQLRTSLNEIALGVPTSVQQLIVRQLERLSTEEQRVLEAASIAGENFSTAAIATGLETELERIEECCESLARREHFLQAQELNTWPDGTITGCYRFVHALYQQVVYERIGAARRMRLHQRIGGRLEAAYDPQTGEIAAELALHFEQGQDCPRAVKYLQQAAQNALQRSANIEAIDHLSRALELLKNLPDTLDRTQLELTLQLALGAPLMATKGFTAPEVERVHDRARELSRQVGETSQLFHVVFGLFAFYVVRAEYKTARELTEQLLSLAQRVHDPALILTAHQAAGQCLSLLGELVPAREHLEQGIALYDRQHHHSLAFLRVADPGVTCYIWGAFVLWHLGYPDQALQRTHEAITLARELSHPYSLVAALGRAAMHSHCRREGQTVQALAGETMALATEQGFPYFAVQGAILQGWAIAEQEQGEESITQILQGLAAYRATGAEVLRPYSLALLAEAYGKVGQGEEGLNTLAEVLAIVDKTGERFYEAELYRLKGELTLQQASQKSKSKSHRSKVPKPKSPIRDPQAEAEACFHKAIEIARQQKAKSLELRAVMSLARLWQQQGKKAEAHQMLSEIYNWFTEGFDTKDLQEAKALLGDLSKS